jgi:hypothetical protein
MMLEEDRNNHLGRSYEKLRSVTLRCIGEEHPKNNKNKEDQPNWSHNT